MIQITRKVLQDYRKQTYLISSHGRINSPKEAVNFINARGFIFFWPIKGIELPSLWVAAAGERPVPDEHDDPGHETWRWKDDGLGKRLWYYAKVLRHKGTFISLGTIPYFYALSPNYGEPDQDYLLQYQEGTLPSECKQVFEALMKEGPLDTISLRKAARIASAGSETRFAKALDQLQGELKILPVGTAEVGAWKYAYVYELTHRHFPGLPAIAGPISERDARKKLVQLYLESVGASPASNIRRVFGWTQPEVDKCVVELVNSGSIVQEILIEGSNETCAGLDILTKSATTR